MKKLKLSFVRLKGSLCINQPHYSLREDKTGLNIACILVDPCDVHIIKEMVKRYNSKKQYIKDTKKGK